MITPVTEFGTRKMREHILDVYKHAPNDQYFVLLRSGELEYADLVGKDEGDHNWYKCSKEDLVVAKLKHPDCLVYTYESLTSLNYAMMKEYLG